MTDLVFVTGNQHKADYLTRLLGRPLDHQKVGLDEIQAADVADVGAHKARQAYEKVGRPVIIDDFGLCFDALDGLPGPFVKYFVEQENGPEKLCRMLDGFETRRAKIVCTIAYCDENGVKVFRKELAGTIVDHPRGTLGIHTDMIFAPDDCGGRTRAELTPDEYDKVYMKVRPIEELKRFLESLDGNA